jgi:hypothetical protein
LASSSAGGFIACGLEPEGIIAMDFSSLAEAQERVKILNPKPSHWCLSGMCNDKLMTLYEEKDGVVLINKFNE